MTTALAAAPTSLGPSVQTAPSATPSRNSHTSAAHSASHSPPTGEIRSRKTSAEKRSPIQNRLGMGVPKVFVKKEPVSPEQATNGRHRPRHLDLTKNNLKNASGGPLSGRPMTARESGLAMQDVLSACLSPGFNTSDPAVQQQLQRSMNVRDQQRLIIEARQKGHKPTAEGEAPKTGTDALFKPNRNTSRRKGPPPMLSIDAPTAAQFANERVIQSAPLGASFTGLRHHPDAPLARQVVNQQSNLSQSSHIHHVPAIQTSNRLPPIADVFPGELQSNGQPRSSYNLSPGAQHNAPLPSPGYPPSFAQAHQKSMAASAAQGQTSSANHSVPSRRDFKNADEAMRSLTGGREELLPRLVHYGGHQPPTPPSPAHKAHGLGVSSSASSAEMPSQVAPRPTLSGGAGQSSSSRRRDRDEYEKDNGSPPLGRGPAPRRQVQLPYMNGNHSFRGSPRDSPETSAAKKRRFLEIVEEAWDLFHS